MKIEVGKFYKFVSEENEDFNTNDIVIVRKAEDRVVEIGKFDNKEKTTLELPFEVFATHFKKIEMAKLGESVNAFFDAVRKVMYGKEEGDNPSSKPAHYDTAIDTIAFAKANFSREQVEGFMRINAVKYLQRNKGEKLSDLRKCAAYVQMLIELEEEE